MSWLFSTAPGLMVAKCVIASIVGWFIGKAILRRSDALEAEAKLEDAARALALRKAMESLATVPLGRSRPRYRPSRTAPAAATRSPRARRRSSESSYSSHSSHRSSSSAPSFSFGGSSGGGFSGGGGSSGGGGASGSW